MKDVVELKNVEKIYRMGSVDLHVLNGISMSVADGERVAIMGPSGSGKSTMLHIIGCLDRPTSGSVHIDGKDVSKLSDSELSSIRSKKIGFVFQTYHLIPTLSTLGNVLLPMTFAGSSDETRARKLLEMVGLGERIKHMPNQLSGGERQRVAIARAMANNPKIILADEPTGNLDSKSGKEIMEILLDLNKQGTTLIIITHDQHVASYSERIFHIKDGRIVKGG